MLKGLMQRSVAQRGLFAPIGLLVVSIGFANGNRMAGQKHRHSATALGG
jgi:hypothetical protein